MLGVAFMVNLASPRSERSYLGQGVTFPLGINQQGNLELSLGEDSVKESIWLILLTKLGERVYRPDFGCRLSDLAFAPMNTQTLMLMRIYVREALDKWEPRIILEEILTDPDPARGQIDITINYRLRDSYESRSLVYFFYLQTGATI